MVFFTHKHLNVSTTLLDWTFNTCIFVVKYDSPCRASLSSADIAFTLLSSNPPLPSPNPRETLRRKHEGGTKHTIDTLTACGGKTALPWTHTAKAGKCVFYGVLFPHVHAAHIFPTSYFKTQRYFVCVPQAGRLCGMSSHSRDAVSREVKKA